MSGAGERAPPEPGVVGAARLADWALAAAASLLLASWIFLAAAHVDDRYAISHVSGTWMALAQQAASGILYPPLLDSGFYGGTRYMPLQIELQAGISELTGEYLVSGKLVSYGATLLLLGLVYAALRRFGLPRPHAFALTAALLATQIGFLAATSIYGDVLPALLQVAALLVALRRPGPGGAAAAGLLCALALLAKVSALWAPLAIGLWLLVRSRSRLPAFLAAYAAVAAGGIALFEAVSDGRMLENLRDLSFSGFLGADAVLLDAPRKLLALLEADGQAAWAMLPIAGVAVGLAVSQRRLSLVQLGLLSSLAVLLVVLADQGTDYNQLLDLQVLTVLAVGELWSRLPRHALASLGLAAIVFWTLVSGWAVTPSHDLSAAVRKVVGGGSDGDLAVQPLKGLVAPRDTLLSEDPGIPVGLGMRPVVLDAFMFLRLGRHHPQWTAQLVRRLERREFDVVVLQRILDTSDPWWRTNHVGERTIRAVAAAYRFERRVGGYWLYTPRPLRPPRA